MATYRSILEDAFESLALASYIFDLTPEELATAYRKLNQMMAVWEGDGISLGYLPSSIPVVESADIGVPDAAEEAIYTNLALRLAPGFGKQPAGQLVRRARQSLSQLGSSSVPVTPFSVPVSLAGSPRAYAPGSASFGGSGIAGDCYPCLKSALIAGTNVTLSANDTAKTITIAATGGGSTDAATLNGQAGSYYLSFANATNKPTTLAGYGITDAQTATGSVAWSRITAAPTTLAGYGITDAQAAGNYITALTGDATASGPGSAVVTLANTTVTAGTYTAANITVDSKGRITAAASGSGGGGGTVTSVSVVSANGFAGTVATAATTPAITLSTTVTGLLKGNGTSISAATAGTDYQAAGSYITALTGDVTASGPGSATATLANTAVTAGSYTNANITVDGKGRVTAASNGAGGGGSGTVTSVSVVTANGVSGSVANASTTPAITLTLGAITPTTVNAIALSGTATPTLAVTGTSSISGSNTGDQTNITGNAGTATALQTARNINGVSFNGTANITVTANWNAARTLSFTGDATGSNTVDGSANVATGLTLATVNGNVGSFRFANVTVNAKGLVTAVSKSKLGINTQTTSYTLVLTDEEGVVRMNVASANNLTIPPNSSVAFDVGSQVTVFQVGVGKTTIVAGSGVTITNTNKSVSAQYGAVTLVKIATDTWDIIGATIA